MLLNRGILHTVCICYHSYHKRFNMVIYCEAEMIEFIYLNRLKSFGVVSCAVPLYLVRTTYFLKVILLGKNFTLVIKCSAIFFIENFLCEIVKFKFHSPNFCITQYLASFIADWVFMIGNSDRFLIFVNLISALKFI